METTTATPTTTGNQPITTKRCTKCGKMLPITEFYKRSASDDGLQLWCKTCTKLCNAKHYANKRQNSTAAQSVMVEQHHVFSKMHPREIQSEIRERINYLRSTGWNCEVKLTFTQVKEVVL